jgi:predicted DNA-binding transcriptional regulator YafY
MTAGELARELEVSERTVYRDVLALSGAGIPIYAEQGRGGGYRLVGGYRTGLTGLSREEAEALFLSGLPGPAGQLGLAGEVAAVRLKMLAALPPALRDATETTGRRFHLDIPGWWTTADPPPLLTELARASWADEVVELTYRRDREVTRTVEPYGLVLKAGIWYLVARVDGGHRTYRVDRAVAVEPTGVRFERDQAFDLPAFWAERTADFVASMLTAEVTVRLSPQGMRTLGHAVEAPAAHRAREAAGEPDADGWVVTRLPVESLTVGYSALLRLGPEVEVLGPPELRERMTETAARLAELYGSQR